MIYLYLLVGIGLSFYIAGFFEDFIIKNCTNCGKEGKLTAICLQYSCFAPGLGLKRKPLGVIHDHFLCSECHKIEFQNYREAMYGDLERLARKIVRDSGRTDCPKT